LNRKNPFTKMQAIDIAVPIHDTGALPTICMPMSPPKTKSIRAKQMLWNAGTTSIPLHREVFDGGITSVFSRKRKPLMFFIFFLAFVGSGVVVR
jgi:hypothetical protein